jgi:hypothetical protein
MKMSWHFPSPLRVWPRLVEQYYDETHVDSPYGKLHQDKECCPDCASLTNPREYLGQYQREHGYRLYTFDEQQQAAYCNLQGS